MFLRRLRLRSTPSCGGGLGTDDDLRAAPTATPTTIATLMKDPPKTGRFTVEGFVQAPHHCGRSSPGAACKPCVDTVFLSDVRAAYKGPISEDTDLRIRVHDATKLETAGHYRLTIEVCPVSPTHPLAGVEIRGYRRLE